MTGRGDGRVATEGGWDRQVTTGRILGPMAGRRYNQYCGVARALDVVGERWSLLIVRDLLSGPQRYSDLLKGLGGIPTDMLASRLRHLEAAGLVRRVTLPPPAGSKVYELTERGAALETVVVELSRWGTELLGEPTPDDVFRLRWLALALRARFDPGRAVGLDLTVNFEVDGETLSVRVAEGELTTLSEPASEPDVVISGDPAALVAATSGSPRARDLDVRGDVRAAARLSAALDLPVVDAGASRTS